MSADLLRRAAKLMRANAEAAQSAAGDAPWTVLSNWSACDDALLYDVQALDGLTALSAHSPEEVAEHIASWHPAVALAIADWLLEAEDLSAVWHAPHPAALAVARAYLAEPS